MVYDETVPAFIPYIAALACSASGRCLAVDGDPANTTSYFLLGYRNRWRLDPLPAWLRYHGLALNAISCTANICYAAGRLGSRPVVLSGWGVNWTLHLPPMPSWAARGDGAALFSIDCTSAYSCVAVGAVGPPGAVPALLMIAYSADGHWHTSTYKLPPDRVADPRLFCGFCETDPSVAVKCPRPRSCTIMVPVGVHHEGELLTGWANTWKVERAMDPHAPGRAVERIDLTSLACPAVHSCVGTANFPSPDGHEKGLLLVQSRSGWRSVDAPLPSSAIEHGSVDLAAVACRSSGNCLAAGSYEAARQQMHPMVLQSRNDHWIAEKLPVPSAAASGNVVASVSQVQYPARRHGMILGSYGAYVVKSIFEAQP